MVQARGHRPGRAGTEPSFPRLGAGRMFRQREDKGLEVLALGLPQSRRAEWRGEMLERRVLEGCEDL